MRRWLSAILLAGMVGVMPSHALAGMSLSDAVRATLAKHPTFKAFLADRDITGFQLKQAQGRLLPQVSVTGDIGAQYVDKPNSLSAANNKRWRLRRQIGVNASQVLFDGWDRANDIYKNAARVDAASYAIIDSAESLALQAVEAFLDVRRHRILLSLSRQNIHRHARIMSLISQRVRGGKAPRSDLTQARERLLAARAVKVEIERALAEARAKFRKVVGRNPHRLTRTGYPRGIPRTKAAAIRLALAGNPAIKALTASVDAARFEKKQKYAEFMPQFSLEGSVKAGRNLDGTPGRNVDVRGGLTLRWNLFDGNQKVNRVREYRARLRKAKYQRAARAREVVEVVEKNWANYVLRRKRLGIISQQVYTNQRVVATYREEYELSKRSLLDLLDSESALFNNRFQRVSEEVVQFFSGFRLLATLGRLNRSLGVRLPAGTLVRARAQAKKPLGPFNIKISPLTGQ